MATTINHAMSAIAPLSASISSEHVVFDGALDATLSGRLDRPTGGHHAVALFAHCFTCSKESLAAARISAALAARGIATLRFDFTGLGGSGGDFSSSSFSSNVEDLLLAADFLRETVGAPQLLVGHSLGGAAVIKAAAGIPEVAAVATLGAPSDTEHVKHLFDDQLDEIEAKGHAGVHLAGRHFTIRADFVRDLEGQSLHEAVATLSRPLLVMHSPADDTVGIDHASNLFVAAKHPKSFCSLDGANHLLTREPDAVWAADVIAAWAGRYLDARKEPAVVATTTKDANDQVVVRPTGVGKFQHTVKTRAHQVLADEPESMGGDDTGMTPYDFLLGGLGACTSMTLRMYADRKEWPLDDVVVRLSHEKIHAKDCADCETKKGKVDVITREVVIVGDLDDAQRTRLLEIADMCPVHRTLHSEVQVKTVAADE